MFFFKSRSAARSFASKRSHYLVKDLGGSALASRRWSVIVLKSKAVYKVV
jgi:hypothetical protein